MKCFFKMSHIRPEQMFLFLGALFSIIWFVVIPPFQAPDDDDHFRRAYMISEGSFVGENQLDKNALGGYLPKKLLYINEVVKSDKLKFHPNEKQSLMDIKKAFSINFDTNDDSRVFVSTNAIGMYAPTNYLMQASAIFTGRYFQLSPLMQYYMARIGNIILYLLLGYWSIRVIPILKIPMMLVFLMPILLNEAASSSADVSTIGITSLLVAYIFHVAFDQSVKHVNNKNLIVLGALFIFTALAKGAYIPLFLLYLLIPAVKFKSKKQYYLDGVLLTFVGISACMLWALTFHFGQVRVEIPVSPKEQIIALLLHPLYFLKLTLHTFFHNVNTSFLLGWLDTKLPKLLKGLYIIGMLFPCFMTNNILKENANVHNIKNGIFTLGLFLIMYIEIHAALYITWPQHSTLMVEGVQGRYFLPFIMLLFAGIKFLMPIHYYMNFTNKWLIGYYFIFPCMLLWATWCILIRYYG